MSASLQGRIRRIRRRRVDPRPWPSNRPDPEVLWTPWWMCTRPGPRRWRRDASRRQDPRSRPPVTSTVKCSRKVHVRKKKKAKNATKIAKVKKENENGKASGWCGGRRNKNRNRNRKKKHVRSREVNVLSRRVLLVLLPHKRRCIFPERVNPMGIHWRSAPNLKYTEKRIWGIWKYASNVTKVHSKYGKLLQAHPTNHTTTHPPIHPHTGRRWNKKNKMEYKLDFQHPTIKKLHCNI